MRNRLTRRASIDDLEQETCELSPKLEGRIVRLTAEVIWTPNPFFVVFIFNYKFCIKTRRELALERQRIEADSVIPEGDESVSPRSSFDQS